MPLSRSVTLISAAIRALITLMSVTVSSEYEAQYQDSHHLHDFCAEFFLNSKLTQNVLVLNTYNRKLLLVGGRGFFFLQTFHN